MNRGLETGGSRPGLAPGRPTGASSRWPTPLDCSPMAFLLELWVPILAAAVFVFLASSVIHMLLPVHRNDYRGLPDEEALQALARIAPGDYVFPWAGSMAEMQQPDFTARLQSGPVGFLTLMPHGSFRMGSALAFWFLYSVLISAICAYIAHATLDPGAEYLQVFRITGAVAFTAYAFANAQSSIWKGVSWIMTLKFAGDGLVYALVTAGAFAWLWPAAA